MNDTPRLGSRPKARDMPAPVRTSAARVLYWSDACFRRMLMAPLGSEAPPNRPAGPRRISMWSTVAMSGWVP